MSALRNFTRHIKTQAASAGHAPRSDDRPQHPQHPQTDLLPRLQERTEAANADPLEASLSLNATVDNKAVSLDPNATRVILGALQVQANAAIQMQFKTIGFLKKVAFKVNVTAGTDGVGGGFSIEIPIPSI